MTAIEGRVPVAVGLAGCSIVRPPQLGGRVEIPAGARARRVVPARLSHGLGFVLNQGAAHTVVANGRRMLAAPGSVAIRAPGCVWEAPEAVHGFVAIEIAGDLLPEHALAPTMTFVAPHGLPDIVAAAHRLAIMPEDTVQRLVAIALATLPARNRTAAPGIIDDACAFLARNVSRRPTLEHAAAAAGVSKFTLLRRFRQVLGTTPHAYLVMLRVARAQTLLAAGSPPAEVAHEAGFSDQSHLGRCFRRALGITPGTYARELLAPAA